MHLRQSSGMWKRNGLRYLKKEMTYIDCNLNSASYHHHLWPLCMYILSYIYDYTNQTYTLSDKTCPIYVYVMSCLVYIIVCPVVSYSCPVWTVVSWHFMSRIMRCPQMSNHVMKCPVSLAMVVLSCGFMYSHITSPPCPFLLYNIL